jgi:hypothetical protein
VAALVEAMFMAELENQLLTAGHDLAEVQGTIRLGIATVRSVIHSLTDRNKPSDLETCSWLTAWA